MVGFDICAATLEHLEPLYALARHLDTVNLPADRDALRGLLARSEASFSRAEHEPARREYVFVLRDLAAGRVVGTSTVVAKLGRRDAPYIYFDVRRQEKYSQTLDRHFIHTILYSIYSYDGPTELAGLVIHPDYRGRPERLGTLISLVRLLFVGSRPDDFEDELLAELLPPLEPDGLSHLWEAVGRRFTGLSYREADRLSKSNKEFIRGLFPDAIYATLLSARAQAVIGEVGEQTRPVAALLSRIGFRYADRVDPFDGGPHYTCARADCVPLRRVAEARVAPDLPDGAQVPGLVCLDRAAAPHFQAWPAALDGRGEALTVGPGPWEAEAAPDGPPLLAMPLR